MEEWKIACGATRFTYGETYDEKKCPTNQPNSQGHTSLMHGRTAQVASGSYANCRNEAGIFDMNGNLEEWVLDDWRGLNGNLTGGAWYTHWKYADCSSRYSREPDYRLDGDRPIDSAGVRCCWSEWELTNDDIKSDAQKHNKSNQSLLPAYDSQNEVRYRRSLDGSVWISECYDPCPVWALIGLKLISYVKKMGRSLLCTAMGAACTNDTETVSIRTKHKTERCNDEGMQILAGTLDTCTTSSGIADLTGNVWEWTSSDLTVAGSKQTPLSQSRKSEVALMCQTVAKPNVHQL